LDTSKELQEHERLPEHIVSFSGGKDSTAMLLMMIEKKMQIDKIIYVDTTKDFPGMYQHIEKVEKYIGMEITKVSFDFDYWFSERVKTKGKDKGGVGYGWMGSMSRWCTSLKVKSIEKLKTKGCIEYIGIAFDEKKRLEKKYLKIGNKILPLVDWGITEKMALEYCYSKGFDWGGLYKIFNRVSCWCCPLARIRELKKLYSNFPELWKELKIMDSKSVKHFRADYTVGELEKRFESENNELYLFKEV